MSWPHGRSTTGVTLTPSTGLGPTTRCAGGSLHTTSEFVARLRSSIPRGRSGRHVAPARTPSMARSNRFVTFFLAVSRRLRLRPLQPVLEQLQGAVDGLPGKGELFGNVGHGMALQAFLQHVAVKL